MTDDTYTLLNAHGEFHARGVSINDMMLIMDWRWGGTLVCDKTGAVLFDAKKDRPECYHNPETKVPAAERRSNLDLAWSRWHEAQGK